MLGEIVAECELRVKDEECNVLISFLFELVYANSLLAW